VPSAQERTPDRGQDTSVQMPMSYDLSRFTAAQADVYPDALAELRAGRKRTHWMWFVFPQIAGLGSSAAARLYAIGSLTEARAYLADAVLGPRLIECTFALLSVEGRSAEEIMGYPDDLKLRSSMTLFRRAAPEVEVFQEILDRYYDGKPDPQTLNKV
jgi:uncharacterized protein (DUF1810 family)